MRKCNKGIIHGRKQNGYYLVDLWGGVSKRYKAEEIIFENNMYMNIIQ